MAGLNPQLYDYGLYGYVPVTKDIYRAPEVLSDKMDIDQTSANVYAFGMFLWFWLMGEEPYLLDKNEKKLPTEGT